MKQKSAESEGGLRERKKTFFWGMKTFPPTARAVYFKGFLACFFLKMFFFERGLRSFEKERM